MDDKGKAQPAVKVEKKNEEAKPEVVDKGKAKSYEEEKKVKEVKEVKKDEKTLVSVCELLMNSKIYREALVMALDHKKIPISYTPKHMVCSLIENPPGAMVFTDDDLPSEGRDHYKALFIKAEVKGKLTCCVMVDNGSTINMCPLKILPKLGLIATDLKPSEVVIKA